jgi:hypothetical protein
MIEKQYKCKDGREILICVDECQLTAAALTPEGQEIGRLCFNEIEYDDGSVLKLIWAYLDKHDSSYRFQGIGRECIKQMIEVFGHPIVAEDHDGHQKDDGSHLTGDAPGFVAKMRSEGLILPRSDSE